LELEIDDKKFIDQFELENKWVISKVFLWLIYAPIYNLLVFLIELFSWVFWWAVIWLTLILKIFLFYPQQKALVSQRKIQDLQPKIKKIQEEYKWQQQIIGQKLLELYNKEKVNPLGSCWFLLIQMPILLVVYNVISKIQNPVNNYYIYSHFNDFSFTSINFNFYWLDLLASKWMQWIILALFVAWIQFLQLKVSLPKKVKDNEKWLVLEKKENKIEYSAMPNPDVLNKFMLYWMPVMVWIFTYSWFAAIWLYWWISTLLTLFQNLITNKISKK
jgi:YidC/Oxa1 family membrane protein insertase